MEPDYSDIMMCAVCKRVLDTWEPLGPDGPDKGHTKWRHNNQDKDVDHDVVPVPVDPDTVKSRCDFCNREHASRTMWTLPVADYYVGHVGSNDHWNSGDYACCEDCAEPLGRTPMAWALVLKRILGSWLESGRMADERTITGLVIHLEMVQAATKGPPYLESEI